MLKRFIPSTKITLRKFVIMASLFAMFGMTSNAHAVRVLVAGGDAGTGPFITEEIFANGDLTGNVDRLSWDVYRELTTEQIVANYDVIVIPYNTADWQYDIDWSTRILPFMASGGGVVWEANITTGTGGSPLITGSLGPRYVCPDSTICYIPNSNITGPVPLDVTAVAGLTDGLSNDYTSTLGYFTGWDAALSPFLQVDATGLGTSTYALQGNVDAGRVVISQLYTDRNASSTGNAQQLNSYNLLKNSIQWTASSTASVNPDLRFVPDVINMSVADANASIAARNLVVANTWNSPSVWYAQDTVRGQSPQAGAGGFVGDSMNLTVVPVATGAAVTVPDVIGMSYADADAVLESVNLSRECCISGYSATVPAGQIITQYPRAGEASNDGWVVAVVMSNGPLTDGVPVLKLMNQAEAEAEIAASGYLTGNVIVQNHPTIAAGIVIDQTPAFGSLAAGSSVDVVVSAGPAGTVLVTVPGVVGQIQADAEAAIVAAGLTATVTTAFSDTVVAGTVINQSPAGGVEAAEGSVISLVVSSGPAPAFILVPDVTGLTQANAESAVSNASLSVGTISTASSATVAAGNVISQTPAAGSEVAAGSTVDLLVSTGPAIVTVPAVIGQSQANAEAAIIGAGLTVGNVSTTNSNTVAAGDVISQTPAGGTDVTEGTAVDLVISSGPALVVVPNVVGDTYSAAVSAITSMGLTVGNVSTVTTRSSCGIVNSQSPVGGNSVQAGTAIDLVVTRTRRCNPL
jgi:beta-lactam-binding protein with PASTA domain